jgi:nitrogen regulatory protein P-II 1
MIRIDAIIKPHKLEEVQKALLDIGVQGMTVSEVKGFGRQKGHTEMYRGAEYRVDFIPKLLLSLVIPETIMEDAIGSIQKAASTGKIGDGKIFVSRVDNVVRIRTGETGRNAI